MKNTFFNYKTGTMKYNKLSFGALFIFVLLSVSNAMAQGPVQPEAMQFEPVDVTDVVNLATGDFVYTIPIMNVPGPAGDYPIVLSYHSGIGPNQPATWVGLGWSLNPGAVNRVLNGYPDDYHGDYVQTLYESKGKKHHGVSITGGWGPLGVNMSYDTYSGFGANLILRASYGSNLGIETSIGSSGVSNSITVGRNTNIGFEAGTQGFNATAGIGFGDADFSVTTNGQTANYTFSSNGANITTLTTGPNGSSLSVAGTGFSAVGSPDAGYIDRFSYVIPVILPNGFKFSVGYYEYQWVLFDLDNEASFGSLYQNSINNERYKSGDFIYPSKDQYLVSAQGILGSIALNYQHGYVLRDHDENDKQGFIDSDFSDESLSFSTNSNPSFKMDNDRGYNTIMSNSTDGWGSNYSELSTTRTSSKKVEPIIVNNKIEGFVLTDNDGMTYEFSTASHNYFQYSETIINSNPVLRNFNSLNGGYATTWFLTSIKGPDYVDRGVEGVSNDDWGYWFKFNYESASLPQVWRAPYEGYAPMSDENVESFSLGIRETLYLKSIESKSHIAKFNTPVESSKNQANPNFDTNRLINPRYTIQKNRQGGTFYFLGDFGWLNKLDGSQIIIEAGNLIKNCFYDTSANYNQCTYGGFHDHKFIYNSENLIQVDGNYSSINIDFNFQIGIPWCSDIEFSPNEFNGQCHDYSYAELKLSNIVSPGQISFKHLDNIELFVKHNLNDEIGRVKFNYDYSLRKYSNGSIASESDGAEGGSLTLKSIQFEGKNKTRIAPPYRFEYANGDDPGVGLNPHYHKYNYDVWGRYRNPNNGSGLRQHNTIQDQSLANFAAAWSLSDITTPTGSKVKISYESDDYYHVNDTYDFKNAFKLEVSSFSNNQFTINGAIPDEIVDDLKVFLVQTIYDPGRPNNFSGYSSFQACTIARIQCEQSQQPINCPICEFGTDPSETSIMFDDIYKISSIDRQNNTLSVDEIINQNHNGDRSYQIAIIRPKSLGGGIRVSSIETIDGSNRTKTNYEYNEGIFSTGVTTSLPNYSSGKHPFKAVINDFEKAFLDHDISFGRPAPGIIYSKVRVKNVNHSEIPINGYSEFEFYTARDYPYSVEISDYPEPDADKKVLIMNDKSVIYGRSKSTSFFEQLGINSNYNYRPKSRIEYSYTFSDDSQPELDLDTYANVYKNLNGSHSLLTNQNQKPLGINQQKHVSRNEITNGHWKTTRVEKIKQNIFETATSSIKYFYDTDETTEPTSSLSKTKRVIGYDMHTGQPLVTVTQTENPNESYISKTTPAWWVYEPGEGESPIGPTLFHKNMLTQSFETSVYKTAIGINDISGLLGYDFTDTNTYQDVLSSSVTTWSSNLVEGELNCPNVGPCIQEYLYIWRKNDTYQFISGFDYEPFEQDNSIGYSGDSYQSATETNPWEMISNIVQYDNYGHVIESVNKDGTYNAVLMDEGNNSLVLAVATNAKLNEVDYEGFNTIDNSSGARTGTGYGSLLNSNIISAPSNPPSEGGKYKVGFWYKSEAPNFINPYQVNPEPLPQTNNEWKFAQILLNPGESISTVDPIDIDDITIIPEYASISYFAYDPLTWKVTAMTGPDHRTTFYEYDDAGRLIYTKDFEGNYISKNEYGYGNEFEITGPSKVRPGQEVSYSINPTDVNNAPEIENYTWSFGDGSVYTGVNLTDILHTYEAPGDYSVSVSLFDANNNTRRVLNDIEVKPLFISLERKEEIQCESINETEISCDFEIQVLINGASEANGYTYKWWYKENPNDSYAHDDLQNENIFTKSITKTNHYPNLYVKVEITDDQDGYTIIEEKVFYGGQN